MTNEKTISGESTINTSAAKITGSGEQITNPTISPDNSENTGDTFPEPPKGPTLKEPTLKERITFSTKAGGLDKIPDGFDDPAGDWRVINSDNPFEVLYIDYRLINLITPTLAEKNYLALKAFWKQKSELLNTGANRIAFKNKYGDGTVEMSLEKLEKTWQKLNSSDGIKNYYNEINNRRIHLGEKKILEHIGTSLKKKRIESEDIDFCISKKQEYDLNENEIAEFIEKQIKQLNLKPYNQASGTSALERIRTGNKWMTEEQIGKEKGLRIEIFKGKYASTIEEIGRLLFENEPEAYDSIKEDIIKNPVAQKNMVLGREIGQITKSSLTIEQKYLNIIYKLNPKLPFRIKGDTVAQNVNELCGKLSKDEFFGLGKLHLKKGNIEIWLKESDSNAYNNTFIKIRDTSPNIDIAYLEFLYAFNKTLPYRFNNRVNVNDPEELFEAICKNAESWNAGIDELFGEHIAVWLRAKQYTDILKEWNGIKNTYVSEKDSGLEAFLRILKPVAQKPEIKANITTILLPAIPQGETAATEIMFENTTRGYIKGIVSLKKPMNGVSISKPEVEINQIAGIKTDCLTLLIDTTQLMKGVKYENELEIKTSTKQTIIIPITFKIVFPKTKFILITAAFSAIFAAFFAHFRNFIARDLEIEGWLSFESYQPTGYYQDIDPLGVYGLLFILTILVSVFLLIRYLIKKKKLVQKK